MPFQPLMPDGISVEESEALARFVHDLESRMEQVADLLNERGTPNTAILAGSILRDLRLLEDQLLRSGQRIGTGATEVYSTTQ
jgi:hypothetical protein